MVIHSRTNDITNKGNTLQKIRKVINAIKENDVNDEIEIVLSNVIHRDDQDLEDKIIELNRRLENLCKWKDMRFIDNSNIKSPSLGEAKHVEANCTLIKAEQLSTAALLTKNFVKKVNSD